MDREGKKSNYANKINRKVVCIFIIRYLKKENIDSFLKLDKKVYSDSYQVDAKTTLERLKKNPYTDITIMDGDEMVGYISICPVDEKTFKKIIAKKISEKEIEERTIAYDKPGVYFAYLSSIVIDKESYPWFQGKTLMNCLENHLLTLRKRGIFITEIVAVAVSVAGKKTLERYRFIESKVNKNVFFYNCSMNKPSFIHKRLVFCALQKLLSSLKENKWVSV